MSQTPIEVLGASVATLGEAVQGMEGELPVLVCAEHEAQGMNIDALAHEMWSGCRNSLECSTVYTYAGDCEQDPPMRPKCLVALHSRMLHIERQLEAQAKRERDRQRKRRAPASQTSESPDK